MLLPTNLSKQTQNGKPIMLKGATFNATFDVSAPAMQPTPAGPVPDPVMTKPLTVQFITTNIQRSKPGELRPRRRRRAAAGRARASSRSTPTATRREWTFGELLAAVRLRWPARSRQHGVRRGSVVLTLVGNTRRVRAGDPRRPAARRGDAAVQRAAAAEGRRPAAATGPGRRWSSRPSATGDVLDAPQPACPVLIVPDETLATAARAAAVRRARRRSTRRSSCSPRARAASRSWSRTGSATSPGSACRRREWMAAQPGELVWSTAAPGWSKSARNSFIAPWLGGAAALLQDERFDPAERLATDPRRGRERAVHGADRVPAHRGGRADRRAAVAAPRDHRRRGAGRAGVRGVARADRAGDRRRLRADRDRSGDRRAAGRDRAARLDGPAAARHRGVEIVDGELCVDPATVPTFFLGYDGGAVPAGMWHTGDQVRQDEDGWLFFVARADDVIISLRLPHRAGRGRVDAARASGRARVRGARRAGRGARADRRAPPSCCATGVDASDELVAELQEHVRAETAPYKYPRRIWFVDELPKTNERQDRPPRARPARLAGLHPTSVANSARYRRDSDGYGCEPESGTRSGSATASSSLLPTTSSAASRTAGWALATA